MWNNDGVVDFECEIFQWLILLTENAFKHTEFCFFRNFTHVHNVKYGNCYTFNAFNNSLPTLHATYSGPLMGKYIYVFKYLHEY